MSAALTAVGVLLVLMAFGFLVVGANIFEALGLAAAGSCLLIGALAYDSPWAQE